MWGNQIVQVQSEAAATAYLAANPKIQACMVFNEPASLTSTGQQNGGAMYVRGVSGSLPAGQYYGDRGVQYHA